jgi:hypothetical protein
MVLAAAVGRGLTQRVRLNALSRVHLRREIDRNIRRPKVALEAAHLQSLPRRFMTLSLIRRRQAAKPAGERRRQRRVRCHVAPKDCRHSGRAHVALQWPGGTWIQGPSSAQEGPEPTLMPGRVTHAALCGSFEEKVGSPRLPSSKQPPAIPISVGRVDMYQKSDVPHRAQKWRSWSWFQAL